MWGLSGVVIWCQNVTAYHYWLFLSWLLLSSAAGGRKVECGLLDRHQHQLSHYFTVGS